MAGVLFSRIVIVRKNTVYAHMLPSKFKKKSVLRVLGLKKTSTFDFQKYLRHRGPKNLNTLFNDIQKLFYVGFVKRFF